MIITCPQCATQYNLSDSAVRHGAKARCAQCKTIFVLHVQAQAQGSMQSQGYSPAQVQPQQIYTQAQNQSQNLAHTLENQHLHQQNQQYIQNHPAYHPQVDQTQDKQHPIVADGLPPLSPPPHASSMDSALGGPAFMQGATLGLEGVPLAPHAYTSSTALAGEPVAYHGAPSHSTEQNIAQYNQAPYLQSAQSQQGIYNQRAPQVALDAMDGVGPLMGQANLAQRPSQAERYALNTGITDSTEQAENTSTPFQSFMTGLLLLIIFGMLGYGAWRYMPRLGNDQLEAEASRIAHVSDQIKDISLHNVRQYTVQSAKAGLLLVLEGRVINNFRSPREMVKVEVALYDKAGNRLESTQQLCGILVSKLQMQIWDASEIEAALDNELEAYAHNVNIASGTSVPFMVVFVNPPASVASYGVHVVDAQIPPSK